MTVLQDMTAAVKGLDSESYKKLVKAHNGDVEMSVTNILKKENRGLLEKVYAKVPVNTKNSLVFEDPDTDADSEDETLSSKTSVTSTSKLTVKKMCEVLKSHPDYTTLVKGCNNGKEMGISTLAKKENRDLLNTLYSKISDGDRDSDDVSTLDDASVVSKRELGLVNDLKKMSIENARLKQQLKALTGAAPSKPASVFKTLKEIQAMTGTAMNDHIDALKAEYEEDAFKAAVVRMKTTMTKIKGTPVKERPDLIIELQEQLEG